MSLDRSRTYRLVTAAVGILFVVLAVVTVAVSDRTAGPLIAAAVIGGLGVEALFSAWRSRSSLLSRIGPLP